MSSFLCFICHSTVTSDTSEELREKYREVVSVNLCPDAHLCHICCHVLNKLWHFKTICLKRSLEYPVLFSEKGTLNLYQNDLEVLSICTDDICSQYQHKNINANIYHFQYEENYTYDEYDDENHVKEENHYVCIENDRQDFEEYFKNEAKTNFNNDLVKCKVNNDEVDNDNENNDNVDVGNENHFNENNFGSPYSQNELSKSNENSINEVHEETNCNRNNNNENRSNEDESTNVNKKKKIKKKKSKKQFEKIILTLEQQKLELERKRKTKKYIEAVFKCYNCALGFLFKDTYQTHMMRHEESNGEYRCVTCTLRFASPAVLRAHKALHAARYACARCHAHCTPRARHAHARACCQPRDGVTCHLCAQMFKDGAGLQQHLKRFHKSKNSNKMYPCSVCGNTYGNQAAVRTHMIKHINRKFQCDTCSATYSSPYTLNQHKKTHIQTNSLTHYCSACNVGYTSRKSLLAHMRNSLNHQQTLFECPVCTRVCPNQRSLNTHIEAVHSGTKNYACTECNARYSNRKSLVRHIGTHVGKRESKTAVCHLCGASFKGNSRLNRHLREVCEKAKMEEEYAKLYDEECINTT